LPPLRLGEEKKKERRKKPQGRSIIAISLFHRAAIKKMKQQGKNIMSASATQGGLLCHLLTLIKLSVA